MSITGGTGADRIIMGATLTSADSLDGGAGTDVLQVSQGFGNTNIAVANFETLAIQNTAAVTTALTGATITNTIAAEQIYDFDRLVGSTITTTSIKAAEALQTLNNVASGHTLVLNGQDGYTGAALVATSDVDDVTVAVKSAQTSLTDVLNINVGRLAGPAGVGAGTTNLNVDDMIANYVETINFVSEGANAVNIVNSLTTLNTLTNLTITGSKGFTLTGALAETALRTIDASLATGAVTISSGPGTGVVLAGTYWWY